MNVVLLTYLLNSTFSPITPSLSPSFFPSTPNKPKMSTKRSDQSLFPIRSPLSTFSTKLSSVLSALNFPHLFKTPNSQPKTAGWALQIPEWWHLNCEWSVVCGGKMNNLRQMSQKYKNSTGEILILDSKQAVVELFTHGMSFARPPNSMSFHVSRMQSTFTNYCQDSWLRTWRRRFNIVKCNMRRFRKRQLS